MIKTLVRTFLLGIFGILLLSGIAGQDQSGDLSYRTGLIPLSGEEVAELVSTRPQVTRVHLNRIGYERINEVRKRNALPPLDPLSVRPVGREFESAVLGPKAAVHVYTGSPEIATDIPAVVDNSKLKYFPPIRDQNSLSSCAAFATTYTQLSYMTAIQYDLDIHGAADDTNKFSPKWVYNMVNEGGDAGASFNQVYSVLEKHGAATWADFPYDANYVAWCLVPSVWRSALYDRSNPVQIVTWASTDQGLAIIKELLANGYVLVFGTSINSWRYRTILDDPSTTDDATEVGKSIGYWVSGEIGPHAMTIVGYNDAIWVDANGNGLIDAGEKGGFRIANSWGTSWEDSGFTWLAYDALKVNSAVADAPSSGRKLAFFDDIVWVLTARESYSPLMVAEFTINHAKRNQLKLTLGRSEISSTTPTTSWNPSALQNQGGSQAFDGTTTAVDAGFVLDYTDILAEGAGIQRYHLGIKDNLFGDAATLLAFKLIDLTTDPPTETVFEGVPQIVDEGEVYSYVDYDYAGPTYNHPPALSDPLRIPTTTEYGTPSHTFIYQVSYYDWDGDAPSVQDVVIDGVSHAMSLESGTAADGSYRYETSLPLGSHDYCFSFVDSRGESARAPLTGTLSGPEICPFLISMLSRWNAVVGEPEFILSVRGSDIVDGAVVRWGGSDRPTTFVSSTEVTASIGAADLAVGNVVPITVRNPDGGISNPLLFSVINGVPALGMFSPKYAAGGGNGLTLTLWGAGFVPNSVAYWNNVAKATTFIGPTELRALISAADIAAGGEYEVKVHNPDPGGGVSGILVFPVSSFTVVTPSRPQTVTAGQSAVYGISVLSKLASFDSPVTLECRGLPRGVTASFSQASVTPGAFGAYSRLILNTTSRQSSGAGTTSASSGQGSLLLSAAMILALSSAIPPLSRRRVRRWLAAGAAICLIVLISSCSAGGGGGSTDTGTPAGTYQIEVRGTSGALSYGATVGLVVI